MNRITGIDIHTDHVVVFAALNASLLALWDIQDRSPTGGIKHDHIAGQYGIGCDAWMAALTLLAAHATPYVVAATDKLANADLLTGAFAYEHVEVSRVSTSTTGPTVAHALWQGFVLDMDTFCSLASNYQLDGDRVARIVEGWCDDLISQLRQQAIA